jgi:hypothetical protein
MLNRNRVKEAWDKVYGEPQCKRITELKHYRRTVLLVGKPP